MLKNSQTYFTVRKMCLVVLLFLFAYQQTSFSQERDDINQFPKLLLNQNSKSDQDNNTDLIIKECHQLAQSKNYDLILALVGKIYNYYLKNNNLNELDQHCLNLKDKNRYFEYATQSVFYEKSIAKLRESKNPYTIKFMNFFNSKFSDYEKPLFHMSKGIADLDTLKIDAGFHREKNLILIDPFKIKPNEWMLKFTHELVHALDDRLHEASKVFGDTTLTPKLISLLENPYYSIETLSPELQEFLPHWIYAGLDLGLFGEYRAWVIVAQIYYEEVSSQNWQPVDWFNERIGYTINQDQFKNTFRANIYYYLNSHSPNPEIGILTRPELQKKINDFRNDSKANLPPLYNLEFN